LGIEVYCQPMLQISSQTWNVWFLEALCSAAVTPSRRSRKRYAPQPEILRYANHVADRFDLRRDIRFNTRVHSAVFDDAEGCWVLEVGDGERVTATYCVMATGCLSSANLPKFAGIDSFQGERSQGS
jgi:cation diffusion facilitator CzcD-associated flavoprotein CzcO